MPDDFEASVNTTGTASAGIPVFGEIEEVGDQDWFAVSLVQGNTYRIEVRGNSTFDGTLVDPVFVGVYDNLGAFVGGRNNDGGTGLNAESLFVAEYTGIHYFSAGAAFDSDNPIGRYVLEFNDLGGDESSIIARGTINEGDTLTYSVPIPVPPEVQLPDPLPTSGSPDALIADVSVSVITQPGTATPGEDFTVEYTFGYSQSLTIRALPDAIVEDDETILVTVSGTIDWIIEDFDGSPIENLEGNIVNGFIETRDIEFDVALSINSAPEGTPLPITDYTFTGPEIIGNVLTEFADGEGEGFSVLPFSFVGDVVGEVLANGDLSVTASSAIPGQTVLIRFDVEDERGARTQGEQSIRFGAAADDYLPGETATIFGTITPEISQIGNIERQEDRDRYVAELQAGQLYSLDLITATATSGTLADPEIFGVYDSLGNLIPNTSDNDTGLGLNASVASFTVPTTAFYEIEVGSHTPFGIGAYELTLTDLGQADDFLPGSFASEYGSALVNVPTNGIIETDGDRDRFDVTLQAGVRYNISVEGAPSSGGSLANPELIGLFNSSGGLVAGTADNNSGIGENALASGITVGSDGVYQVEVASAGDIGVGDYTLTVEFVEYLDDFLPGISGAFGNISVGSSATGEIEAPGDIDGFRVFLDGDTTYQINLEGVDTGRGTLVDPIIRGVFESGQAVPFSQTFDDDAGAGRNSLSNFTPPTTGEYFIEVTGFDSGTGAYTLSVDDLGLLDDFAADVTTTGSIAVGGDATGRVDFPEDADWFEVNLSQGRLYQIELAPTGGENALADPFFYGVYDRFGNLISNTENDDGGTGQNSRIQFTTEQSGTFYLSAGGVQEDTGQSRLVLDDLGAVVGADTFDISIDYQGPDRFRNAFENAAERWEDVIIGDLPFSNVDGFGFVDDILIEVSVDDLELTFQGVEQTIIAISSILEQRAPSSPVGAGLPTYSRIVVNESEADRVIRNIDDLAANTIGRALGFGSLWEEFGLVENIEGIATYTGLNGLRELAELNDNLNGANALEDGADGALAEQYWREAIFDSELMTPRIEFRSADAPPPPFGVSDNPLSALTVAAMEDLGYQVDYDEADFFRVGSVPEDRAVVVVSDPASPAQSRLVSELAESDGIPVGATYIYERAHSLAEQPAAFNLTAENTELIGASGVTVEFLEGATGENHLIRLSGSFDKTNPTNVTQISGTVDEMEVFSQSGTLLFSIDYSTKPVAVAEVFNGWPNMPIDGENTIIVNALDDGIVRFNPLGGAPEDNRIFTGPSDDFVRGGSSAELIDGGADHDMLIGGGGNDTLTGASGNDSLEGSEGNDTLNGNGGADTAIFSGNQASYTLTLSPNQTTITDRRGDGNGTDQLNSIEFLDFDTDFSGAPFNLQVFGGPTGLAADDFESFIELYIAYFNRAPDAVGLFFWGTAFANGTSLNNMASLFVGQPETQATYPEGTTTLQFATSVYNNVLGRTPDQTGLDFWVNALDSGSVTRDAFILEVLRGAKAALKPDEGQAFVDQQLADRAYLSNKTDIGAYFAVHKGMSDVDNAAAAMALFDGSQSSINAAVSAIDGYYASALNPTDGEFLMPLIGVLDDPFTA